MIGDQQNEITHSILFYYSIFIVHVMYTVWVDHYWWVSCFCWNWMVSITSESPVKTLIDFNVVENKWTKSSPVIKNAPKIQLLLTHVHNKVWSQTLVSRKVKLFAFHSCTYYIEFSDKITNKLKQERRAILVLYKSDVSS